MMKKNGFTLAEVLITLAIIGVVATMTLPALMTNTQEQQARTGIKKGINTLTEAAQMNQSLEGWDYASVTDPNDPDGVTIGMDTATQAFDALIANRTTIDYGLGNNLPDKGQVKTTLSGYKAIYLRDGSAIYYDPAAAICNANTGAADLNEDDGLPEGFVVYYDTNGIAGPNIVSNCAGTALGAKDETMVSADAATTACDKTKRVLKDVYALKLRGNIAVPAGNASTWMVNGDVKVAAGGNGN